MNKKSRADLLLIGILLVLAGVFYLFWVNSNKSGSYVVVKVNGAETNRYAITDNGTYVLNGGTNVLVIEDGTAYVTEADCPDKLCVHQGKIKTTGQAITCLPNKLTVTIEGNDSGVDIVSQ